MSPSKFSGEAGKVQPLAEQDSAKSAEASGTHGLLPASRVRFRGVCAELAGTLRGALQFIAEGSPECGFLLEHIGEQTWRVPPLMPTEPVDSFSDLGDTNFQYPEVPWYPDPPAPEWF